MDGKEEVSRKKLDWHPEGLVYELNISRRALKKHEGLKKLQKWIQKANDCGQITRQEAVSMLPPLVLNPKHSDIVFDMCAAPGSKTSQMLEMIYHDYAYPCIYLDFSDSIHILSKIF